MNKRGFTLVELLAVIVILSLLALLTSTAVTKLVKDAKGDLNNTQIELIKSAAQTWGTEHLNWLPGDKECSYLTLSNLKDYGLIDSNIKDLNRNEKLSDNLKIKISTIRNEKSDKLITTYEVNPESVEGCYQQIPIFDNGDVVYFDVLKGQGCDQNMYNSSYDQIKGDYLNSSTGYNGYVNKTENNITYEKLSTQNSCLKFYAFNDNGGETLNLLLDHNTSFSLNWSSSATIPNTTGPVIALEYLNEATSSWNGTITPSNYSLDQSDQPSQAKYIIDYSKYKARLITAQEIAQITGADKEDTLNFNEISSGSVYHFDSLSYKESDTCKVGNTTECKYGWLYDRLGASCTKYGCLNNSDMELNGYWTSTANATISDMTGAWLVYEVGNMQYDLVDSANYGGVRPVIEVLKFKLQ